MYTYIDNSILNYYNKFKKIVDLDDTERDCFKTILSKDGYDFFVVDKNKKIYGADNSNKIAVKLGDSRDLDMIFEQRLQDFNLNKEEKFFLRSLYIASIFSPTKEE